MEAEIRELLGLDPFQGSKTTTAAARTRGAWQGPPLCFPKRDKGVDVIVVRIDVKSQAAPEPHRDRYLALDAAAAK